MTISTIGKIAGALALSLSLAGCIDATMEVEVTSTSTAKGIMTQVMDKSIYDMVQASAEGGEEGASAEGEFCAEGELTLAGETATCTITKEGPFADLVFDEEGEEETVKFTVDGNLVRVAFPTKDMTGDLGSEEDMDAETKAMMASFFEGHTITLRVSGGEIVDTNMTIAGDKRSAEQVIPFLDLINGEVEFPEELYAVVKK